MQKFKYKMHQIWLTNTSFSTNQSASKHKLQSIKLTFKLSPNLIQCLEKKFKTIMSMIKVILKSSLFFLI